MALDIDGFAAFRGITAAPQIFAEIGADLAKAARALVTKQIRHKNTSLEVLRHIRAALGPEAFNLIMDGLADAQIKSLATKLDKHNTQLTSANAAELRSHVLALAGSSATPIEKQKAAPKQAKPRKTAAPPRSPDRIHFSSAGAVRKR